MSEKEAKPVDKASEQTLMERIMKVMEDVMTAKLDALEKSLDAKIDAIVKSKEAEVELALRKGFGLEQDPVVHMSDLIGAIRKATLEQAETQKRTPAPVEKGGPEGTEKPSPLEDLLTKYGVKIGAEP